MMYTIQTGAGLYSSKHPDGGDVAYLYHHRPHAQDQIDNADSSAELSIEEILDLERWLQSLRRMGITHVYEVLTAENESGGVISNLHNVEFRLAFLSQGFD